YQINETKTPKSVPLGVQTGGILTLTNRRPNRGQAVGAVRHVVTSHFEGGAMSGRNNRTNRGSAKDAGRVAVWAAGIALAVAGADAAHAAEYYLQASQGTSATWNQLSQ